MVKKQLNLENLLNEKVIQQIDDDTFRTINPLKLSNFTKVKDGNIGDILRQRHSQRAVLFYFSLGFVFVTTVVVFATILFQAWLNLNYPSSSVKLVNDTTLQIVVTGIFVQFVGLVGIITKSIWNDKPYLDAGVMNKER